MAIHSSVEAVAVATSAVDVVAIRNSVVVDAHPRNRRAVEDAVAISVADVVATRSSAVVPEQERATDLRVEAEGADATRLAVMVDRGAKHRWTVRAVRQVAARWPVVAAVDVVRAPALLVEAVEA